jgi:hypothetical protein
MHFFHLDHPYMNTKQTCSDVDNRAERSLFKAELYRSLRE